MRASKTENQMGMGGQNLIRILIASYFIGVSLGLIEGTDATPLFDLFLPYNYALIIGCTITLLLAYLVLSGLWLRPIALTLGSVLLASSFIDNISMASMEGAGYFWRDITLVGALMLTYVHADRSMASRRAIVRWRRRVRKIDPTGTVSPRRVVSFTPQGQERQARPSIANLPVSDGGQMVQNLFADGPDEVNTA